MTKIELKIRFYGDPVLRKKAVPVIKVTQNHREVLSEMARLMYQDSGVGLASSQVAFPEAMIVADAGSGLYKLINPKIIKRSGTQTNQEGCLSIPGVCISIKRSQDICVKALDESGKEITIQAQGLLACILQHEIDHLRGRVIVDRATLIDKLKIKNKLEALKKRSRHERLLEQRAESCQLQL